MRPIGVATTCAVAFFACASVLPQTATGEEHLSEKLRERIADYMEVRSDAVEAVGRVESKEDPVEIVAQRRLLQMEIRRRRADAKQGDIFRPDIRVYVRETLGPILRGERSQDIRARLKDDAPEPGSVPLEVNAAYPAGLAFPTTPWPLLAALPTLPAGLTYRIIGRDLLLLDEPADLIIDYMRNALPPRVATR